CCLPKRAVYGGRQKCLRSGPACPSVLLCVRAQQPPGCCWSWVAREYFQSLESSSRLRRQKLFATTHLFVQEDSRRLLPRLRWQTGAWCEAHRDGFHTVPVHFGSHQSAPRSCCVSCRLRSPAGGEDHRWTAVPA